MGSMDQVDEMTFKINFSSEGLEKLRGKVNNKLKEFMGDYTDDTLVDYVIVLLRNGRRKDEARNELNVFLGDDSDPFISWLWDDLASNLNLYAQPQESLTKESDSDQGKSNKLTKRRRNSEWKGPVRNGADPPPLLISEILDSQVKEKTRHKPKHARKARKSRSPGSSLQRKRSFRDDQQHVNRETVSQATANAPRRLLQFAVRDAVGSLKSPNSVNEPSTKRLRSVVSTSTSYSPVVERPRRIKSVASVPNSMATVIKAVADAAEDVRNAKFSRNVFDRLGPDNMDFPEIPDSRRAEHLDYNQIEEEIQSPYLERSIYSGADMTMLETETQQPYDFISHKSYDYAGDMDSRVVHAPQTFTSGGNRDDSLMRPQIIRDQPAVLANKPPNTWNSSVQVAAIGKSVVQLTKDNSSDAPVGNGNAKPVPNVQRESQKMLQSGSGTNTTGPVAEDADSRTIFVSNVHFGATKDLLSRHFNKFGEVLRVVIVTDAATGQPKGCAYVEFVQKEAADNALSFDGTSFMSRIVKVVKKTGGAAHEEAAPPSVVAAWPRVVARAYGGGGRFSRASFPRGAFRGRGLPVMKPGARSLQWKRGATTEGTVPSPTARSLTYVRTTEPKGNPST